MVASREWHKAYQKRYYAEKIAELKAQLGGVCVKCGSSDDLQFDHKDPATKLFTIGSLLSHSKAALLAEILKCQLLCIDCHREKSDSEGHHRGSKNSQSRLTEADVRSIKRQLAIGKTNRALAKEFHCSEVNISLIKSGKAWKHVS